MHLSSIEVKEGPQGADDRGIHAESDPGTAEARSGPSGRLREHVASTPCRSTYHRPSLVCHGSLQELTRLQPVPLNSDGQMGSAPGT